MPFGLFEKGKIGIVLEKVNFSPGDVIKGTVALKLNKPVKAKKLRLIFAGEKTTRQSGMSAQGPGQSSSKKEFVHRFEMSLDGEKEYSGGEYPFEVRIPANVLQTCPEAEGALGAAFKTVQFLGGVSTRIEWYLSASLDIPGGFDINKKVQINVC